jgi:hypothetical protein
MKLGKISSNQRLRLQEIQMNKRGNRRSHRGKSVLVTLLAIGWAWQSASFAAVGTPHRPYNGVEVSLREPFRESGRSAHWDKLIWMDPITVCLVFRRQMIVDSAGLENLISPIVCLRKGHFGGTANDLYGGPRIKRIWISQVDGEPQATRVGSDFPRDPLIMRLGDRYEVIFGEPMVLRPRCHCTNPMILGSVQAGVSAQYKALTGHRVRINGLPVSTQFPLEIADHNPPQQGPRESSLAASFAPARQSFLGTLARGRGRDQRSESGSRSGTGGARSASVGRLAAEGVPPELAARARALQVAFRRTLRRLDESSQSMGANGQARNGQGAEDPDLRRLAGSSQSRSANGQSRNGQGAEDSDSDVVTWQPVDPEGS